MKDDNRIYNTCKACGNRYYTHTEASADEMKFCPSCIEVKNCNAGDMIKLEKKKSKKMSKISSTNEAAKAAGMSYGQYIGWLRSGSIPK